MEGEHVSPETAGVGTGTLTCTIPPLATIDNIAPAAEEANTWGILMTRNEFVEVTDGTAVTVAATPSSMVVAFVPQMMQVSVPVPGLQDTDLDAAEPAEPAVTLIALKSSVL